MVVVDTLEAIVEEAAVEVVMAVVEVEGEVELRDLLCAF